MDGLEITVINLSVQMDVTTENVLPQTFVGKTIWSSIYIYKVVLSVCLFPCPIKTCKPLTYHPVCIGELGRPAGMECS